MLDRSKPVSRVAHIVIRAGRGYIPDRSFVGWDRTHIAGWITLPVGCIHGRDTVIIGGPGGQARVGIGLCAFRYGRNNAGRAGAGPAKNFIGRHIGFTVGVPGQGNLFHTRCRRQAGRYRWRQGILDHLVPGDLVMIA